VEQMGRGALIYRRPAGLAIGPPEVRIMACGILAL
jgi:hypothetical protein